MPPWGYAHACLVTNGKEKYDTRVSKSVNVRVWGSGEGLEYSGSFTEVFLVFVGEQNFV